MSADLCLSMKNTLDYTSHKQATSFYVAADDQDLLRQVNSIMLRHGLVGVFDTAGRVHYLIDGSRGAPYASRKIMEKTGQIVITNNEKVQKLIKCLPPAVNEVLVRYRIKPELKGFRYLRFLILAAGLDEGNLRPISKTLYPLTAEHFRVKVSQVERDIRYALGKTRLKQEGYTATASICRLYDETIQTAVKMAEKEKPLAVAETTRGSL